MSSARLIQSTSSHRTSLRLRLWFTFCHPLPHPPSGETFRNTLTFYDEELLVPRPTLNPGTTSFRLSATSYSRLFLLFTAAELLWGMRLPSAIVGSDSYLQLYQWTHCSGHIQDAKVWRTHEQTVIPVRMHLSKLVMSYMTEITCILTPVLYEFLRASFVEHLYGSLILKFVQAYTSQ
jgi:hypothetical protein